MKNNIPLGIKGEKLAQKYLKKHKYKILESNFKCVVGEVDIIAKKADFLVFVEVKCRTSTKFGLPCEAVDETKQQKIRRVAEFYQKFKKLYDIPVSFAVIEVLNSEIRLIENAF